jgi:hypothetical protein
MSASAAVFSKSWLVGHRTVTMTIPRGKPGQAASCSVEWDPDLPKRLTPAELVQYRAGMSCALLKLSRDLDIRIAAVDL